MKPLQNRHILLGISGGIAAYKSAELVRRLQDAGAFVRVVMSAAAAEFITPLTLQALSGYPVHTDLLDTEAEAGMGHIELARWADAIVIAPASANMMARLAQGRADDLLTTLCLASSAPLALAPAMNQQMWKNVATQANVRLLRERGIVFMGPADGIQACGDTGPGRMLEAEELLEPIASLFQSRALQGKHVVITAGPTREAIDPVRYISNHSSGKMGYALAQAAIDAGAQTTLISGPVNIAAPERAEVVQVCSALEMHKEALTYAAKCDIFIAAAAVADYRPKQCADQKVKKGSDDQLSLDLIKNPDIVADVAKQLKAQQRNTFVVGFAAETQNIEQYAKEKLKRKGLDMIIANDVGSDTGGFNSDDNAVSVFWGQKAEQRQDFAITSKTNLAAQLLALIINQ